MTSRSGTISTSGNAWRNQLTSHQQVVARLPLSNPAWASSTAPLQLLATIFERLATRDDEIVLRAQPARLDFEICERFAPDRRHDRRVVAPTQRSARGIRTPCDPRTTRRDLPTMWQSNRAVEAPRSPSVARALFAIANSSSRPAVIQAEQPG